MPIKTNFAAKVHEGKQLGREFQPCACHLLQLLVTARQALFFNLSGEISGLIVEQGKMGTTFFVTHKGTLEVSVNGPSPRMCVMELRSAAALQFRQCGEYPRGRPSIWRPGSFCGWGSFWGAKADLQAVFPQFSRALGGKQHLRVPGPVRSNAWPAWPHVSLP